MIQEARAAGMVRQLREFRGRGALQFKSLLELGLGCKTDGPARSGDGL